MPDDAPPPVLLREKQTKLSAFLDQRDEWGWLGADAKREPVDPGSLPRLSEKRERASDDGASDSELDDSASDSESDGSASDSEPADCGASGSRKSPKQA